MVMLLTVQEVIQIIIDFFNSIAGIVVISGVTIGGIGYALLKVIRPKTRHERALETALINQSALLVAYKKENETLRKDFNAYVEQTNARLAELGLASVNVKIKQKARQWTVEDAKKAVEIAQAVIPAIPVMVESTKQMVTKLIKK